MATMCLILFSMFLMSMTHPYTKSKIVIKKQKPIEFFYIYLNCKLQLNHSVDKINAQANSKCSLNALNESCIAFQCKLKVRINLNIFKNLIQ